MKSIRVQYFALFRDQAKCEEETLDVTSQTYGDLYLELSKRHGFDLPKEMIQVAVDDEFTSMNSTVVNGTKIVFIPPVAGG
jgi:molybdopterin synthase sulfur carrier subunit